MLMLLMKLLLIINKKLNIFQNFKITETANKTVNISDKLINSGNYCRKVSHSTYIKIKILLFGAVMIS